MLENDDKKVIPLEWPVRELNPDLPKTKVNKKKFLLIFSLVFPAMTVTEGSSSKKVSFLFFH